MAGGGTDSVGREAQLRDAIVEIGAALAAELDVQRLVQAVTEAGTRLTEADFGAFFYNLVDEHGESYTLYAIAGVDRSHFERYPLPRNTAVFSPTFRGERVLRLDDVTADARYGRSAPYYGMPPGHLPVRSYLAVPVVARDGEVLGGLFFGHAEPGRFTEDHERLVVGIAGHAAIAIDNARLYERERRVAEALQRRLLPQSIPELPGLTAAARYVPARDDVAVGGDWYDVVPLPSGSVLAVIGDAEGHSLDAAALMGRTRSAMLAYALDGHTPGGVLERMNNYLLTVEPEHLVTCCIVELSPDERIATIAVAGHPPPLIQSADGEEASYVDVDPGPPLGVVAGATYPETSVVLEDVRCLVLYTDGLVERRDASLTIGLESLRARLASLAPGLPSERIVEQLVGVQHQGTVDDVAVLVLSLDLSPSARPAGVGRHLPPETASVAAARSFTTDILREWGLEHLVDRAELLVSELVTNAVLYTASHVELRLSVHDGRLRVEVIDESGERPPAQRPVDLEQASGRGLLLVQSLASTWGVDPVGVGKSVWFELERGGR
jgi:serine phosphatase RsbU (regulator of sigma subunit)/anti-sigma regulatory factor (Ser/Thr protein kinase)